MTTAVGGHTALTTSKPKDQAILHPSVHLVGINTLNGLLSRLSQAELFAAVLTDSDPSFSAEERIAAAAPAIKQYVQDSIGVLRMIAGGRS